MLFGSCSGSSLILPFSRPVVAFCVLTASSGRVSGGRPQALWRGEPQVHLSLPFMSSTEALSLFVDHSVDAAAWQKDWRATGGGRSSRTGSYFTSHPANRASRGWTEGGRVVSFEENTKYQAVRISPGSEFRLWCWFILYLTKWKCSTQKELKHFGQF